MTLPSSGGRLVLASDGLWDALNPKTAMHSVRGMNAGQAAHHLVPPRPPPPLDFARPLCLFPLDFCPPSKAEYWQFVVRHKKWEFSRAQWSVIVTVGWALVLL